MFESANCTVIPAQVPSDAGIAGAGVSVFILAKSLNRLTKN